MDIRSKEKKKSLSYDEMYLKLAKEISYKSHCVKKKVGAVISKYTRVISLGYNGPPAGTYNCDEDFPIDGCPRSRTGGCSYSIHAEQNAIFFAIKNNIDIANANLYVTLSPCLPCARIIYTMGIKKVFYNELYSDYKNTTNEEGLDFLTEFKIDHQKLVF